MPTGMDYFMINTDWYGLFHDLMPTGKDYFMI